MPLPVIQRSPIAGEMAGRGVAKRGRQAMDHENTRIWQALRSLAVMAPVVFGIGGVVTTGCGSDAKDTESPAPPQGSAQMVDASGGTFERASR